MRKLLGNLGMNVLGNLGAALLIYLFGLLLTYLFGVAFQRNLWNLEVPFWILPLTVALLAGPFVYALRKRRRAEESHNVLVMLSAFERHTYFAEVLRYIIASLGEMPARDGLTLQAVVSVPRRQYDRARQKRHLDDALRRQREYVGALIVPVDPGNSKGDLAEFVRKFGRPVVFFDTDPELQPEDYTPYSCFIGVDDKEGGELAAAAMAHELKNRQVSKPRIFVLPAGFHEARERSFMDVMRRKLSDVDIVTGKHGYFDRDKACQAAKGFLAGAAGESHLRYDGAFCTGDEMALGFLDAVDAKKGAGVSERLVVIGYDGINEARRLIDGGDLRLRNTVVQNSQQLGESVVFKLISLLNKERDRGSDPKTWLKPELYRSLSA